MRACVSVCVCVTPVCLSSGVPDQAASDPTAELQRTAADESPPAGREGKPPAARLELSMTGSVYTGTGSDTTRSLVGFQYDSDGSDSQESSEEAELRRKKLEVLKVSQSNMSAI